MFPEMLLMIKKLQKMQRECLFTARLLLLRNNLQRLKSWKLVLKLLILCVHSSKVERSVYSEERESVRLLSFKSLSETLQLNTEDILYSPELEKELVKEMTCTEKWKNQMCWIKQCSCSDK